jgi:hypothetical protein
MGKGVGRALFNTPRGAQWIQRTYFADPNAEAFYERLGAKRIGDIPADMFGQARVLPRMRVEL